MSLWNRKEHRSILDDAEDFAHPAECGSWTAWIMGWAVPFYIAVYSLNSIIDGTITLLGRNGSMTITGPDVRLLGAAYLALAMFLHLHFIWSAHEKWWEYAQRLKVLSLLVFLPCLLVVLYHQVIF